MSCLPSLPRYPLDAQDHTNLRSIPSSNRLCISLPFSAAKGCLKSNKLIQIGSRKGSFVSEHASTIFYNLLHASGFCRAFCWQDPPPALVDQRASKALLCRNSSFEALWCGFDFLTWRYFLMSCRTFRQSRFVGFASTSRMRRVSLPLPCSTRSYHRDDRTAGFKMWIGHGAMVIHRPCHIPGMPDASIVAPKRQPIAQPGETSSFTSFWGWCLHGYIPCEVHQRSRRSHLSHSRTLGRIHPSHK